MEEYPLSAARDGSVYSQLPIYSSRLSPAFEARRKFIKSDTDHTQNHPYVALPATTKYTRKTVISFVASRPFSEDNFSGAMQMSNIHAFQLQMYSPQNNLKSGATKPNFLYEFRIQKVESPPPTKDAFKK
jgi:hypothetical protein